MIERLGATGWMYPRAWVVIAMLVPTAARADESVAPVMPLADTAVLPASASSNRVNDAFMGAIGVSAEVTMLAVRRAEMETDNGTTLRACGTLRLGPFIACVGAHKRGDTTRLNLALDALSFQRNGWAIALGYGTLDGLTLRTAVPLTFLGVPKRIRLRLMGSFGGRFPTSVRDRPKGALSGGGGLEVDVW